MNHSLKQGRVVFYQGEFSEEFDNLNPEANKDLIVLKTDNEVRWDVCFVFQNWSSEKQLTICFDVRKWQPKHVKTRTRKKRRKKDLKLLVGSPVGAGNVFLVGQDHKEFWVFWSAYMSRTCSSNDVRHKWGIRDIASLSLLPQ